MMLRIVAGLSLHSMSFASEREPTGSPEFTYDRTMSFRISRGLSSSCRASAFGVIATFIASGNYGVNGWVGYYLEFNREMLLKSTDECASELLHGWSFCKEFRNPRHFLLQDLAVRQTRRSRQRLPIAGNGHGPMLQKAGAHAPLRAANDLPALNHQFVPRW